MLNRVLAVVLFSLSIISNAIYAQDKAALDKLNKAIYSFATSNYLKAGWLGVSVRNSNGNEVIEWNNDKYFIPASTTKLFTTAATLNKYGPEYRFSTDILTNKALDISDSTLNGSIYIKPSFDPTFGSERYTATITDSIFKRINDQLKENGIESINGCIYLIDPSNSPNPVPDYWEWQDLGNYYGAGVYPLNWQENTFKAYYNTTAQIGSPTKIDSINPPLKTLTIHNKVKVGNYRIGDRSYFYGSPFHSNYFSEGEIQKQNQPRIVKGAIPFPLRTFIEALKSNLTVEINPDSILIKEDIYLSELEHKLFSIASPSLLEIIKETNTESLNLYAEALLLLLAKEDNYNRDSALDKLAIELNTIGCQIDENQLYDGSGLSRTNLIKPSQQTQLLYSINTWKYKDDFKSTLAISSKTGTLEYIFSTKSIAAGRIRAKSGTLKKVICYSGYINTLDNEEYTFSIMVNNYTGNYTTVRQEVVNLMELFTNL